MVEEKKETWGDGYQDYYRVIVSSNVHMDKVGEYFIRGVAVYSENRRVRNLNQVCLFNGEKTKMAERDILISDYVTRSEEGYVLVKIDMLEGGLKKLHAGTTLGYIKSSSMMIRK